MNALGVRSGPSPFALTIPSAPQHLFSKEEGPTARLKWAANPEKSIKGYRVYRLDGQYIKTPMVRVTPDPVAATEFADPSAGPRERRFYVVAVDALGQEGIPSTPVWHQRGYAKIYAPFMGEWHQ